ncbi:MAG TPA: helix-turn-helix domain-containing protein, partial [Promineifilum sp.]|nr:helix-turn-helix domain-containing protein [Promineifilum sp.]
RRLPAACVAGDPLARGGEERVGAVDPRLAVGEHRVRAAGGAPPPMPDVMTPEQAAEILQVTVPDVIAAIEAGELKAKKIGAAYRISKANLDAFLGS